MIDPGIEAQRFEAVKALWHLGPPIALWVLGGFAICIVLALFGGGPRPRFVKANLLLSLPLLFLPLLTEGWRGVLVQHGLDALVLESRMAAMGRLLDMTIVGALAMAGLGLHLRRAALFQPEGTAAAEWRRDGGSVLLMQGIALSVWWSYAQVMMP